MANEGKVFEADFKKSFEKLPYYYMRIIDSAKWLKGENSNFTPSNEADAIQHSMPFLFLLELKSTKGSGISFNPNKPDEKPENAKTQVMIKASQVKALSKAATKDGVIAGLIINFRERSTKTINYDNAVYFIHIIDFVEFAIKSEKATINREDCENIGVVIEGKKKKVHYTYDIEKFKQDAVKKYINCGYLNKESLKEMINWIGSMVG